MSEPIVSVTGVSKKFAKDHSKGLVYGLRDILRTAFGFSLHKEKLRASEFWAVSDINLQVSKGDILGVLGRNGSGKTTLMRVITGIYPADLGNVKTEGRILAMFALKSGMQVHLTGRENIYLKGYMLNLTKKEIDEHLEEVIAFAELENHIDNLLGSYSDGMRARIGFAIATCVKPDIFIVDEGLSVGDHAFRLKCFKYLKNISPETAIVFVTNSVQQAEMLANRILVMKKGKVAFMTDNLNEGVAYYLNENPAA